VQEWDTVLPDERQTHKEKKKKKKKSVTLLAVKTIIKKKNISIFRASLKMVHDVLGHGCCPLHRWRVYTRVPKDTSMRACAFLQVG